MFGGGGQGEGQGRIVSLVGWGGEWTLKAGSVLRWHVGVWKLLSGGTTVVKRRPRGVGGPEKVCVWGALQ